MLKSVLALIIVFGFIQNISCPSVSFFYARCEYWDEAEIFVAKRITLVDRQVW